ncbi:MAG: enoyl-CoA hydratase-related protein [Alphaproteobacteria bacterium]
MTDTIFSIEGAVATLTFNRPDRLNAFSPALITESLEALARVKADPTIKALVITGAGRGFCAGADLTGLAPSAESVNAAMRDLYNPLIMAIQTLGKPTVAAINGVAAGAGVGIALSCDIAVAARSASFVLTFGPNLGLVPDLGCTWFLPRAIGRARSRGLALLGDKLPAQTALDWGLIWQVTDDAVCLTEAQSLGARLARGSGETFAAIGRLLDLGEINDLESQLDLERETQTAMIVSDTFKAGVASFLAKKKG